jgi:hypothetical protein
MLKIFATIATMSLVSTGAMAHTCADMRNAFNGGDNKTGMDLVVEALLPQFARRDGGGLNINKQSVVHQARSAVMFVCKNGYADTLEEAGDKAAFYVNAFNLGVGAR